MLAADVGDLLGMGPDGGEDGDVFRFQASLKYDFIR